MPTHFQAGGCLIGNEHDGIPLLCAPNDWTVPAYLNNRPLCLPTSDQGATNRCVSHAWAGWCEAYMWDKYDVYKQIDPLPIHYRAKEIDGLGGSKEDGTTLEAGAQAVLDLKILPGKFEPWRIKFDNEYQYCVKKFRTVVCAFWVDEYWNECNPNTGMIPDIDGDPQGYHAVLGCTYDNFLDRGERGFQNSWLPWGFQQSGFGRMTERKFRRQFMHGMVLREVQ